MRIALVVLMMVLLVGVAGASEWIVTYGGHQEDWPLSIQQTKDGGYVVAGVTMSFGAGGDIWVLKLDSNGNIEWQKAYGGDSWESVGMIQQTSDGGYIIVGDTQSFGGANNDIWILKLDRNGNIQWQKAYDGGHTDVASAVQQTSDGGYIVAGHTQSFGDITAFWILKLDADGDIEWQKAYDGNRKDVAFDVKQTSDGGYIIVGVTQSFGSGGDDIWVLKLDRNGNIQWQKAYGGKNQELAVSIQEVSNGGYIVAGFTKSFGSGGYDVLVIKLDQNGNIQWQKAYGGSNDDYASAIRQTFDGGYIIVGKTYSFNGENIWVLKLDHNGNIQWRKTYGEDDALDIQQTLDRGYIIAAVGLGDFKILKLDVNGSVPYCYFIKNTNAKTVLTALQVTNTNAKVIETSALPKSTNAKITNTQVIGQYICPSNIFLPWEDGFSFDNPGTEVEKGGTCFGMVATASHFYGWKHGGYEFKKDEKMYYAKLPLRYSKLSDAPAPEISNDKTVTRISDHLLAMLLYQKCQKTLWYEISFEEALGRLDDNQIVAVLLLPKKWEIWKAGHAILAYRYQRNPYNPDIYWFYTYDPNFYSTFYSKDQESIMTYDTSTGKSGVYVDYDTIIFAVIKPLNYSAAKECLKEKEMGSYSIVNDFLKNFKVAMSNLPLKLTSGTKMGYFDEEGIFHRSISNTAGFIDYYTDGSRVIDDRFFAVAYPKDSKVKVDTADESTVSNLNKDPITIVSFGETVTGISVEADSVSINDTGSEYIIDAEGTTNITMFATTNESSETTTVTLPGGRIFVTASQISYDADRDGTIDNVLKPPEANFSFSVSDLTVTLDASDSYDPDGYIVSYQWNFGDNTTASGKTVQHTYSSPGTYTVTLTVTDNDGLTASISNQITIQEVSQKQQLKQDILQLLLQYLLTQDTQQKHQIKQQILQMILQYLQMG